MLNNQRHNLLTNFWDKCKVIIPIIGGLIAAFWGVSKHKDDLQEKYSKKIKEIEATVFASDLVPNIVKIVMNVNNDAQGNENPDYEQILSQDTYVEPIKKIAESENKIVTVKVEYRQLQKKLSYMIKNILVILIITILYSIYNLYNIMEYVGIYDTPILGFVTCIIALMLINLTSNTIAYVDLKNSISERYDNIVINIPNEEG